MVPGLAMLAWERRKRAYDDPGSRWGPQDATPADRGDRGEDFPLSGATFIRGFIRNYAKLLKIDAAPVLAALEDKSALPQAELNAPADAGVRMPTANGRHGKGLLGATVLALIVLGIALVLYFDVIDLGAFRDQGSPAAPGRRRHRQQPLFQPGGPPFHPGGDSWQTPSSRPRAAETGASS
jgi:hypothetical protein